MGFEKFCPKCGKSTDAVIHGTCIDCFLAKNKLFTVQDINIEICVRCGKLHLKGRWYPFDEEELTKEVASKVKVLHEMDVPKIFVELASTAPREYEAEITVEGIIDDSVVEKKETVQFKLQKVSCDSCMRLGADYREAIIQLRGDTPEESEAMLILAKELIEGGRVKNSLSGVTKEIHLPTGFDLWIGSKKAAAQAVREIKRVYKKKITFSKKLIGEEPDRTARYRFTFLVKGNK